MCQLKEFIPEALKDYIRLVSAKLRHRDCFVGSPLVAKNVQLGRRCSVSRGVELGSGVILGDASYVNCGTIIASGRIGKYCSIGPYSMIGLAVHPMDRLSSSPLLYGRQNLFRRPCSWDDFPEPPEIGSDVWIGAGVFIGQGVRIGHGAVVGAGAVVVRDVPPFGIVAGVPARLIRYRFTPEQIEELLRSPWWEESVNNLSARPERFQGPWQSHHGPQPTRPKDREQEVAPA
jgi:virginiamycin A acetyltransferase